MWVFRRKIYNAPRKKLGVAFVLSILVQKSTSRLARNTHHKDTYLRLKTDCNPTSVPRRQRNTRARVCPVIPSEGIRDVAEFACRVVVFLVVLVFYPLSEHHFFFGEVENFSAKTGGGGGGGGGGGQCRKNFFSLSLSLSLSDETHKRKRKERLIIIVFFFEQKSDNNNNNNNNSYTINSLFFSTLHTSSPGHYCS